MAQPLLFGLSEAQPVQWDLVPSLGGILVWELPGPGVVTGGHQPLIAGKKIDN